MGKTRHGITVIVQNTCGHVRESVENSKAKRRKALGAKASPSKSSRSAGEITTLTSPGIPAPRDDLGRWRARDRGSTAVDLGAGPGGSDRGGSGISPSCGDKCRPVLSNTPNWLLFSSGVEKTAVPLDGNRRRQQSYPRRTLFRDVSNADWMPPLHKVRIPPLRY
ncbi:hypothetical protein NL676_004379 [Syzygium grande]|nr:hypothetical protein NL676_004379 [Syzygium grande]